jgi:hypothetical protein
MLNSRIVEQGKQGKSKFKLEKDNNNSGRRIKMLSNEEQVLVNNFV